MGESHLFEVLVEDAVLRRNYIPGNQQNACTCQALEFEFRHFMHTKAGSVFFCADGSPQFCTLTVSLGWKVLSGIVSALWPQGQRMCCLHRVPVHIHYGAALCVGMSLLWYICTGIGLSVSRRQG